MHRRTGRLEWCMNARTIGVPELLAPTSSVTSSVITPPASMVSSSSQPVENTSRLPFHSHHTSHPLRMATGCCHSMHSSCSARSTRTSVCSLPVNARKRSGVRDSKWTTGSTRTDDERNETEQEKVDGDGRWSVWCVEVTGAQLRCELFLLLRRERNAVSLTAVHSMLDKGVHPWKRERRTRQKRMKRRMAGAVTPQRCEVM